MASNKYCLGDLITQRREKNPGGDLPIRGVSKEGLQPPKQIDADTSIYNLYYRNDFVYNPARMELGSIAFNDEYDKAICSSLYEVFYVHRTDLVMPEYLALFVKHPEFARYCNFIGNGSAREYCRFDNISGIPIYLPPIYEQRRIVHDYQVITDRIELLRKINETLNAMMSSAIDRLYINVFGDMKLSEINKNQMPDGWTVKSLSEVADCQSGYAFYQDGYDESGIRVVDLGNINVAGEYILTKSDKYVSPDKYTLTKFDKYRLVQNDLVMVMTDRKSTMELLGKTGRIYDSEELMLNQRVYRIRTSPVYVSYLQSYLNSERVHLFHKSRALGTAQKYVNNGDINMIPILIPPKEEFINLCQLFNASWDVIKSNLLEIRTLDIIKNQISSLTHNTKGA